MLTNRFRPVAWSLFITLLLFPLFIFPLPGPTVSPAFAAEAVESVEADAAAVPDDEAVAEEEAAPADSKATQAAAADSATGGG